MKTSKVSLDAKQSKGTPRSLDPINFVDKVNKAKQLVAEAIVAYPKIVVACSFGKDSMAMLHIVLSVKKDIPVFSVLSDTEFPETYEFAKRVVKLYNLNYTEYDFKQIGTGVLCCGAPKVEKTKEALANYDAWITGVRRDEGETRTNYKEIEVKDGLAKINPIIDFTELDVWRYLAIYEVPVNPKYREGYRSLGCALCSTPEKDEAEPERAGRWRNTSKAGGECGIHVEDMRARSK